MFEKLYNIIYILGLQTIRYGKRFARRLVALLLKPVKAVGTLIFTAAIIIDKFALRTFHEVTGDFKALNRQIRRVRERSTSSVGFMHLFKVAVKRYKKAFVYVINIVMPIASLALLLYVISSWSGRTFALEINYNDRVIGYVRTEAVYKEARAEALNRLDISAASAAPVSAADGEKELIGNAEYKLKTVKLSQINDSAAICDKLIENSDSAITNACGIYIDNAFICAVKNETDALSVFDSILSEYETDEDDATVSFVEDIEYVQGLYPDNESTVRDASYLDEKLHSKKSEAKYYSVQAGDTISGIAQSNDITSSELYALNPELGENIYVGQNLLVSQEVNFVRVQITKTETRTVEIPYSTVKVNTDSLYIGDSRTVTKGVNGIQKITELVTYVDGVRVSAKEVSRETVRETVDEKIQVGTKNYSYGSSGGSVTSYGGRFLWPTIGANSVSSYYGKRSLGGWHGGMDIVRPGGRSTGLTVVAAESGTVTLAKLNGAYGYCVMINHGNGIVTLYGHMQAGSLMVSAGQQVSRGQPIGRIGSTGNVTGPHLHFEVRVNGTKVNPAPYLGVSTKVNS